MFWIGQKSNNPKPIFAGVDATEPDSLLCYFDTNREAINPRQHPFTLADLRHIFNIQQKMFRYSGLTNISVTQHNLACASFPFFYDKLDPDLRNKFFDAYALPSLSLNITGLPETWIPLPSAQTDDLMVYFAAMVNLFHDVPEFFTSDIANPVKRVSKEFYDTYNAIESTILNNMLEHLVVRPIAKVFETICAKEAPNVVPYSKDIIRAFVQSAKAQISHVDRTVACIEQSYYFPYSDVDYSVAERKYVRDVFDAIVNTRSREWHTGSESHTQLNRVKAKLDRADHRLLICDEYEFKFIASEMFVQTMHGTDELAFSEDIDNYALSMYSTIKQRIISKMGTVSAPNVPPSGVDFIYALNESLENANTQAQPQTPKKRGSK